MCKEPLVGDELAKDAAEVVRPEQTENVSFCSHTITDDAANTSQRPIALTSLTNFEPAAPREISITSKRVNAPSVQQQFVITIPASPAKRVSFSPILEVSSANEQTVVNGGNPKAKIERELLQDAVEEIAAFESSMSRAYNQRIQKMMLEATTKRAREKLEWLSEKLKGMLQQD